jgi:hypothetical protein
VTAGNNRISPGFGPTSIMIRTADILPLMSLLDSCR